MGQDANKPNLFDFWLKQVTDVAIIQALLKKIQFTEIHDNDWSNLPVASDISEDGNGITFDLISKQYAIWYIQGIAEVPEGISHPKSVQEILNQFVEYALNGTGPK